MSQAFNHSFIDTELQVRLMNLVMGEASDFERDQLQSMMEQRADLAAYHQHLEHLHGLLREVGAGDLPSETANEAAIETDIKAGSDVDRSTSDGAWQLPADRRSQVLAALDKPSPDPSSDSPEKVTLANKSKSKRWRLSYALVGTLALTACVLIGLMLPTVQMARMARFAEDRAASNNLRALSSEERADMNGGVFSGGASRSLGSVPFSSKQARSSNLPYLRQSRPNMAAGLPIELQSSVKGRNDLRERFAREVHEAREADAFKQQEDSVASTNLPTPDFLQDDVQYFDADAAGNTAKDSAYGWAAEPFGNGLAKSIDQPISADMGMGAGMGSDYSGMPGGEGGSAARPLESGLSNPLAGNDTLSDSRTGKPQLGNRWAIDLYSSQEFAGQTTTAPAEPKLQNSLDGETDALSSFMETATPSIIISEEEERPLLGAVIIRESKQDVERTLEQMAQVKESAIDEKKSAIPESLQELQKREISLGRLFTPAPSSEATPLARSSSEVKDKLAAPTQAVALDEQSASAEAFSTFSLHVSDVSFQLAQTALSQGQWPETAKIRIEEFVNALDYHDPLPSSDQKVACRVEQAIHPFLMQRNLLRVSMRTAATGRSQNTPLRLTLLLDNSGSMERPDRRQAVLRAFQTLTQQLGANDQITLISFANTPRLLADKVPGNSGEALLQLIENLPSEGGTNIEAALVLAHEKAAEQQLVGAQNRIVMLTDGAVNLGNANPESLSKLVTKMRDAGIAFDAAGISALDLNDEVLEALTRQGDGRYYLLNSAAAVGESFAAQIAGALRPSAKNVKVQVEFNPQRVGRYKLLGFEKHRLDKEDFRNDQVDAAEMTAAEAGVAVYQFEIKPNGSGDVGNVSVRFRDLATGQMVERRWPIPYEAHALRLEQAPPSMQLAAIAALFAAKLGGGPLADSVDLSQLASLVTQLPDQVASQPRVQQLRSMIEQAKSLGN